METQTDTAEKNPTEKTTTEEFRISGEMLTGKLKELVREGNVRRIIIKNEEGKTLVEIPLTVGVVGTVLLPVWAGIGAIAALVANLAITVERRVVGPVGTDLDETGSASLTERERDA